MEAIKIDTFYTRIQNKHDIEANWILKTDFIPLQGELIIYDEDDNYDYKRLKVGDGVTNVNNLKFYGMNLDLISVDDIDTICNV